MHFRRLPGASLRFFLVFRGDRARLGALPGPVAGYFWIKPVWNHSAAAAPGAASGQPISLMA